MHGYEVYISESLDASKTFVWYCSLRRFAFCSVTFACMFSKVVLV